MSDKKVAGLSRHESLSYCDPAKVREILMNRSDDLKLNAIADARLHDGQVLIEVNLDVEAICKRERNGVFCAATKG